MNQKEAYRQIVQNLNENDDEINRIARTLVTDLIDSFVKSSKKGYRSTSVLLSTSLDGAMRFRLSCGYDTVLWQKIFEDISREYDLFSISSSPMVHSGTITELNVSVKLKEKQ